MQIISVNNVGIHNGYTFKGNDNTEKQKRVTPVSTGYDCFETVLGVPVSSSPFGKIAGKIFNKVKEVGQNVTEKVTNLDVQQKVNSVKLTKLMVENKTFNSYFEAYDHKEEIAELAKLNYDDIEAKYMTVVNNYKKEGITPEKNRGKYDTYMSFWKMNSILSYEKLTPEDINEIFKIRRERPKDRYTSGLDVYFLSRTMRAYDNFENLSASAQKQLLESCGWDIYTESTLQKAEAEKVSDYSSLMKFDYVRDLKNAGSKEEFIHALEERRKNIPCKALETDRQLLKKVTSEQGLEDLRRALNKTDLEKYKNGFKLEYSRDSFINDFNTITKNLSAADKKEVYDYFQFKIDSANDIENYPNPQTVSEVNPNLADTVEKCRECVNKFMLENKICLDPSDKELENVLNDVIKAYPEFISVIGKKQHRGDSIDYHTFDDMKRIMNDSRYDELSPQEKRIMTVATLFHDFGKSQAEIDDGHALKSAQSAKEIIKKMEVSFDEKERIYNLIKHSHWLVEGASDDDIAFNFRRPDDFKMAEIFEKADSNSAGFEYAPSEKRINAIKENINKINTNGIPVFADSLPTDLSKYDVNKNGVRYLDFRDPEASVEKYGYPAGTKVKDLKFLCHASSDGISDFATLCDDSKDVCLSTMLLDRNSEFTTGYNSFGEYILSGNNSNIVLGGKDLSCTGGRRGYQYAKESMYQRMENLHSKNGGFENRNEYREEIPNQIRETLNLSKEEYLELYNSICNYENLEDVKDVKLSGGRVIPKEDIKTTISDIRNYMVKKKEKGEGGYTNEFVVYNPKIAAQVVRGDIDRYTESSVPLVLV
ncbi:MAG: hypothetical protein K6E29_09860 [Cyanobacteria bacterium RUI128]|nr:hypothetical protein [Cyanobacteria bacterium RUI128]